MPKTNIYNELADRQADAQVLGCSPKTFWEHMAPIVRDTKADHRYSREDLISMECAMFMFNIAHDLMEKQDSPDSPEQLAIVHKYVPPGLM